MKKMLCAWMVLVCLIVFPAISQAQMQESYLYSPALDAMIYVENEIFDEGCREAYITEDGLICVEVLTFGANEVGMIGEGSFAELPELRAEDEIGNMQDVLCEGVGGHPAQRIRLEIGENEDAAVVDATAIWADEKTFVYMVRVDADAWYGFMDGYDEGTAQSMIDAWLSEIQIVGHEATDAEECEPNDIGFFENYMDTEFFRVGIPDAWPEQYVYEIVQNDPFGYTITFSEAECGFVFSLEARWFDDEIVQLESVWQGYLGRLNVERLGELDLLVTYSQFAPDANEAWQAMYDTCREVADTLIMQPGVSVELGEYMEYQP